MASPISQAFGTFTQELQADSDILETFGNENEKDHAHAVQK